MPTFVFAQLVGGVLAITLIRWLYPNTTTTTADAVIPHAEPDEVQPHR